MAAIICGVDPGLNGAFAFLNIDAGTLQIIDMPTVEKNGKRHVNPAKVGAILTTTPLDIVYLEHVHSSPQMGVASSFSFGRSAGIVLGACGAAALPVTEVAPNVWKPRMGCTSDKKKTAERATQLMPKCAAAWKLKKNVDRAEATLLAIFGAVSLGHTIPDLILKA